MAKEKHHRPLYMIPEPIMKFFAWVCAGILIFSMALICCDVFMRYFFNSPIQGATETVTMLMGWIVYAGLAYALMTGQHMQLGSVYDKLTGRTYHIVSTFVYGLGFALYCVMTYASFQTFLSSWTIKEQAVAAVTVYVFIGKFGAFLGWLLLGIESLFMLIYCICGIARPDKIPPILRKSELPTAEELGDFAGECTHTTHSHESGGDGP